MNYVEETVEKYDDRQFKGHFRLSRKTTTDLIDLFNQSDFNPKYSSGRPNVSAKKTVLFSLWYLGNRNSFREVSDRFGVAIGTAHGCLTRFLNFLMRIRDEHIVWPNEQQRLEISRMFTRNNGFPGAIGFIDGSHIEIPKPDKNQDSYINRKGYHSLLLQGVVDHNKKFIDVFCGEPGSLHDARLLRRSALYATISDNPDFIGEYYLLGDSAYSNLDWIVTPYPDTEFLSENQKIFNQRLSSKRVVVKNAFGLLKGRFRRLKGLENLKLDLCYQLI
ncbi:protein ANTAGONIST OF LIKE HETEROCHROMATIN PROTEIN 1-like isoform X1 [Coccinella septempunctata]|uniref:protein ANTAGONIST OF LIKE HETEROCHROMATIN PROTEIN 1-like isoform X1 n=1 Tax=Coccinella septempunctata TaxID=41139 RepID=UPI001D067576|nr:protein ANTAGONIST OF LIKE HETEROCHROMATIN PROTEIN 1-like isoform X1 [Coccinella septempunctata]